MFRFLDRLTNRRLDDSMGRLGAAGAYPAAHPAAPTVDYGNATQFPAGYPRFHTAAGVRTTLPTETMPVAMLYDVYRRTAQGIDPRSVQRILVPVGEAPNQVLK